MKRIIAILIAGILLFITTGYQLTLHYLQQRQVQAMQQQLDSTLYNESDLVEITVPLSLPYYNNSANFERYDGEVEVNGITYTYVKRKIEDGKLILKCLPNNKQQTIKKEVSNWFAGINGLKNWPSSQKTNNFSFKLFSFEFEEMNKAIATNNKLTLNKYYLSNKQNFVQNSFIKIPWQPPELIS